MSTHYKASTPNNADSSDDEFNIDKVIGKAYAAKKAKKNGGGRGTKRKGEEINSGGGDENKDPGDEEGLVVSGEGGPGKRKRVVVRAQFLSGYLFLHSNLHSTAPKPISS